MIHSTAIVHKDVTIGSNVRIGPYCVVEGSVCLGDGVELVSHVCLAGRTTVGAGTRIFPFASIGLECQDLKYKGEPSCLEIGARTTIREYVTIHPGTQGGGMVTRVGDACLLMIGVHVAHDCQVGHRVILANQATLGGHVEVGEGVIVGGLSAVHQFVRIGAGAIIGGMSGIEADVLPYGSVWGNRAQLHGLNWVGLKRQGFSKGDLQALRQAYMLLFSEGDTLQNRMDDVASTFPDHPLVQEIVTFMRASSQRGLCLPERSDELSDDDALSA